MIKMKKILLFFCLMFAIMQETKAIVPAIAVNNMKKEQQKILDKKRNSIYNNGLIILNKEEKIQELLDNKKYQNFT